MTRKTPEYVQYSQMHDNLTKNVMLVDQAKCQLLELKSNQTKPWPSTHCLCTRSSIPLCFEMLKVHDAHNLNVKYDPHV